MLPASWGVLHPVALLPAPAYYSTVAASRDARPGYFSSPLKAAAVCPAGEQQHLPPSWIWALLLVTGCLSVVGLGLFGSLLSPFGCLVSAVVAYAV